MNDMLLSASMVRLTAYIALLVFITGAFTALEPHFLSLANMTAILRHMSVTSFAALGVTFVIVVRRFDLSIPGTISFVTMTIGFLIASKVTLLVAIGGGAVAALLIGVINGYFVSYLKFPDIVTTIATGSVLGGAAFLFSGGVTIFKNFFTSGILDINDIKLLAVSLPTYLLIAAAIVLGVLLHRSRHGNAFYATGYNPVSARLSGVHPRRYTMVAFIISSVMMTLCATLFIAETGRAVPTSGTGFLMPAYAAVFIGSAFFGAPSVLATLAGTLLVTTILNGLTLLNVPYYFSDGVVSFVMLASIVFFDRRMFDRFNILRFSLFPGRGSALNNPSADRGS